METVMRTEDDKHINSEPVIYSDNDGETTVAKTDVEAVGNTQERADESLDEGSTGESEDIRDEKVSEDTEELLRELEALSGKRYGSLSEFPEYRRYLELRKSGLLSAEEAFYAVNRENDAVNRTANVSAFDAKRHMTPSAGKRSSGEVFTREDREELAKWGLSATGEALERLWRRAAPAGN